MNFELKITALRERASALNKAIDDLEQGYCSAREFTANFLDKCRENGIKAVAIGVADNRVPASMDYPDSPRFSAFAEAEGVDGLPAIWRATQQAGCWGGCGNTSQAQLNANAVASLIDGVYTLRNGVWHWDGEEGENE